MNTAAVMTGANEEQDPRTILFGRFMLPDSTEHACQVTQLSPEGAVFLTSITPPIGVEIVAYIDEIGRLEAVTGEPAKGGFAVSFQINGPRRERIESRMRSLQASAAEDNDNRVRSHSRQPGGNSASHVTLPDGRVYACEVIDVSMSGAAVRIDVMPALGTSVLLGKMRGRVVRYFESGISIEFTRHLDSA